MAGHLAGPAEQSGPRFPGYNSAGMAVSRMQGFNYAAPETVEEALDLLGCAAEDAILLAGGQSLMILLQQRLVRPSVVIGLRHIGGLDAIGITGGHLAIGAMATYRALAGNSEVRTHAPILGRAAGSVGSVHIRNRGTAGGSLCHADPAGDVPTVLLALGAELVAARAGRASSRYPADTFFTGLFETALAPGEMLTGIEVAPPAQTASYGYRRFSFREGEYPMCVAAVRLLWSDGRCCGVSLAVGGAADRPGRLAEAERALTGMEPSADIAARLLRGVRDLVQPASDVRGSGEWKARVIEKVVTDAVTEAVLEQVQHG